MNIASAIGLFLLGTFGFVIGMLRLPAYQSYTGGLLIALFIAGLLYVWGNAMRQTRKLVDDQSQKKQAEAQHPV